MKSFIFYLAIILLLVGCDKTDDSNSDLPLPNTPSITSPNNNMSLGNCVLIQWDTVAHVSNYHIQIARDTLFQANLSLIEDKIVSGLLAKQMFDISETGSLFVKIRAENDTGNSEWSEIVNFSTSGNQNVDCFPAIISAPSLLLPENGAIESGIYVTFTWQDATNAEKYLLQIASDASFSDVVYSNSSIYDTERTVQGFDEIGRYHWRVKGLSLSGLSESAWSPTRFFDR